MADAELIGFDPTAVLPGEDRVLARSGCPPSRRGRFGTEARKALQVLSRVAEPRALVRTLDVTELDADVLATDDIRLKSASLARFMKGADRVSLLLATIGPGPEGKASRMREAGRYTESYFIDAAASAMVEELLRKLHRKLSSRFPGLVSTARFAPGFGDFDLSVQADLVSLLDGSRAGVSVREGSCMLTPVKSGTGVIGWISQRS